MPVGLAYYSKFWHTQTLQRHTKSPLKSLLGRCHISNRVKNSCTLIRTGVTALLLQVLLTHNTTEIFCDTSLQKAWSLNVPKD